MYAKLVFRNAKRSVKDYLVYLVTMTICVALFYAFLSVSSRYYNPDIGNEYDFTLLSGGMKAAICMITLLLLFLIRFVNQYMLLRRQKEFAVQSILGMEPKTIGRIFFAETLIMGMFSILLGMFLGVFCSQFITAMLLTAYGKPYEISWTVFPDTVLMTVVFFAAVFFELSVVWGLLTGIQEAWFYYDPRFALPVRLMFLENILFPLLTLLWPVFCVLRKKRRECLLTGLLICSAANAFSAASVAALTNQYGLPWGGGTLNQYLLFVLIDFLFFIYAFIYLISGLIAAWKERSPEHRYHGETLFFFGQITSKLNTTSKTMTIICITLALAMSLFVAAPVLTGWSSGYLDARSMYDVQVFSRYNDVYEIEYLPRDSYEIVTDFLAERQIDTDYDCTFHLYLPEKDDFHNRQKYNFPIAATMGILVILLLCYFISTWILFRRSVQP